MAKKNPFDEFRKATLSGDNALQDALASESPAVADTRVPHRPEKNTAKPAEPVQTVKEKPSKNDDRELVSFHINKDLKRKLGFLKFETGLSYNDLYNEAIEDLLMKYGK